MKREAETKVYIVECDGCDYVLARRNRERELEPALANSILVSVPWDWPWPAEIRSGNKLDFHFHADGDCFRYWAHSPYVMKKSLEKRGLDEAQVGEFMRLMLYRSDHRSPGIEQKKPAGTGQNQ